MTLIKEVCSSYSGSLTDEQKDELYDFLRSFKAEDLESMEDHRIYIETLAKLRQSLLHGFKLMGKNFLQMLESLLSVGEDGVYSNNQRFIYELIQNVDDCEYEDITDCHLDIKFDYSRNPGVITFTYNEKGFTPANVFAITGIAEASKNISADKVEIGEKGIGFKSVFGIADKVLIQSGMFSFALCKENFTVPIPCYDGFVPVEGTRLTLEMPRTACEATYRSLVDQYVKGDAILNKNPILFLNKLTHLKMFFDGFRYIEFDVQRTQPEIRSGLQIESNVSVSVDMKDYHDGLEKGYKKEVSCYRYTMPITYGDVECKARYGADVDFSERRHNLIAVFPVLTEELQDFKGMLYSFLPTQIKTYAPIILNVPYKLDGSREYVHSQGNNAWFTYTNEKLVEFLRLVYLDLAHIMKQDVIKYIPNKHNHFFKRDNGKVDCLCIPDLQGDRICKERVFLTEGGTFESVVDIVSFGKDEKLDDPVYVFRLLENTAKLFIPTFPIDMNWYGAKTIENVTLKLFQRGIQVDHLFDEILCWLERNNDDLNYPELLQNFEPFTLTNSHLNAIVGHRRLEIALMQRAKAALSAKPKPYLPRCKLEDGVAQFGEEISATIQDLVMNADLDKIFESYLKAIGYKFYAIKANRDFALATGNGIVLSIGHEYGSFSALSSQFDSRGTFSATLKIRQASDELNQLDDSISNEEYLKRLRAVRRSLKDAFGSRMYNSYIRIIAEAGTDKNRFLSELLQNADDCIYPSGITPSFSLKISGNKLIVSYNEQGFNKDNVRAITAIGESTKKLLLSGEDKSIGEKGVGFKSVFGVAESVEIHSNGFDFKLTDKQPTIPDKCSVLEGNVGTTMIFSMKEDLLKSFSAERILQLCTCLRNLKELRIASHTITIADDDDERVIIMDGQRHNYKRIVHSFDVLDQLALDERNTNGRMVDCAQQIVCYIPARIKEREMFVYSGLPMTIKSNVPLIIDAPFELTTSRENVLHNHWNEIIREQVYCAILHVMENKSDTGLDVLRYVGFRSQNGVTTWQNFDDSYLNQFDWPLALKEAKILPLLGSSQIISSSTGSSCTLVPEFIAKLQTAVDIKNCFIGNVIDMQGKSQYAPLLENIGCKKVSGQEIFGFLQKYTKEFVSSGDFRDGLYAYLSNNQGNTVFEGIGDGVLKLPVFPVKVSGGTDYIAYNNAIYTHKTETSKDDYYILNTGIMSLELADKILSKRGRINELTQEVFDAKYQKLLSDYIENPQEKYSKKQIAEFLLGEFKNNRAAFGKCKNILLGLRPKIPFLMANGNYKVGNKYLNTRDQWYAGQQILSLTINPTYRDLAQYLELTEIQTIHFEDIDTGISRFSDDDIEDLQCGFANFYEIISHAIDVGWITEEQIAKYNLEFGVGGTDDESDPYEEFPEKKVGNIGALINHIRQQWQTRPNPYIEKTYIQWKPQYTMDKGSYTLSMYRSAFNQQKCFCQMCRKLVNMRYIERNDIERNPAFAWEQMYLNLCLNCSKDYILLRHNDILWQSFVNKIMETNPISAGSFEIPLGGVSVTFTATHLAEIQEIFKNQGWGKTAPKRKSVLGNNVDDEVEQEQAEISSQSITGTMSLTTFFKTKGFETIDMRSKGGAFWVVGETCELKDAVKEAAKLYNLTGTYSNGGKATNFRNGWFTKSKA